MLNPTSRLQTSAPGQYPATRKEPKRKRRRIVDAMCCGAITEGREADKQQMKLRRGRSKRGANGNTMSSNLPAGQVPLTAQAAYPKAGSMSNADPRHPNP